MIFADSHTHLYLEDFNADREEMVRRAVDAGVRYLFLPNIDSASHSSLKEMADRYTGTCFPMMGLHPTSVKGNFREEMEEMESALMSDPTRFCAIGEIGIDLYWDQQFRKEQEEVFARQIDLAMKFELPVVIHTRNSYDVAAGIIAERMKPGLKGVFHCFSGNIRQAQQAISLGFYLGIGGVVTFNNSGLQKVVETISLEHLVLETDAPFLAPVPFRGKRNESAYIPYIAQKVAELKRCPIEEVAEITTRNTLALFKTQPGS